MTTISARVSVLSTKLMTIARTQTLDVCKAHYLTHIALLRILKKDPDLEHFAQICRSLDVEAETRRVV